MVHRFVTDPEIQKELLRAEGLSRRAAHVRIEVDFAFDRIVTEIKSLSRKNPNLDCLVRKSGDCIRIHVGWKTDIQRMRRGGVGVEKEEMMISISTTDFLNRSMFNKMFRPNKKAREVNALSVVSNVSGPGYLEHRRNQPNGVEQVIAGMKKFLLEQGIISLDSLPCSETHNNISSLKTAANAVCARLNAWVKNSARPQTFSTGASSRSNHPS